MQKAASKNIITSGSYDFFQSGSQYSYYIRANFKSRYLKTTLGKNLRKPYMVEVQKLVVMFL